MIIRKCLQVREQMGRTRIYTISRFSVQRIEGNFSPIVPQSENGNNHVEFCIFGLSRVFLPSLMVSAAIWDSLFVCDGDSSLLCRKTPRGPTGFVKARDVYRLQL